MTVELLLDTKEFMDIVANCKYKAQDEKEAVGYGYKDVASLYKTMNHRWAEYYVIKDKGVIVCTIALDAFNTLHYFVTTDLTKNNALGFVRCIRKLAQDTVEKRPVIFVHTAMWYQEAMKFNRLIGMSVIKQDSTRETSTWYYSKLKGY